MILVKTEAGQLVMKDRSVSLTPRQRSMFILFDGKKTVQEVLTATSAMGVTRDDVDHMVSLGLLAPPAAVVPEKSGRSSQQRYQDAYPIATELTAALGLRGFRLNLAVEGASGFEELAQLSLKIKDAVGPEKYKRLERALHG